MIDIFLNTLSDLFKLSLNRTTVDTNPPISIEKSHANAVNIFAAHLKRYHTVGTAQQYLPWIIVFLEDNPELPLDKIDKSKIEAFLYRLTDEVTPNTLPKVRSALNSFVRCLKDHSVIPR